MAIVTKSTVVRTVFWTRLLGEKFPKAANANEIINNIQVYRKMRRLQEQFERAASFELHPVNRKTLSDPPLHEKLLENQIRIVKDVIKALSPELARPDDGKKVALRNHRLYQDILSRLPFEITEEELKSRLKEHPKGLRTPRYAIRVIDLLARSSLKPTAEQIRTSIYVLHTRPDDLSWALAKVEALPDFEEDWRTSPRVLDLVMYFIEKRGWDNLRQEYFGNRLDIIHELIQERMSETVKTKNLREMLEEEEDMDNYVTE